MSKEKGSTIRVLFVGGYRPFRFRKAGGPHAVSSPLIDAFALKMPKSIELVVLSPPFKEITLPLFRPTVIKLRKVLIKYIPLITTILIILSEVVKAHIIHVFAGGEPFSILIQFISRFLGKNVITTFHGYRPLAAYFEGRPFNSLKRKLVETLYHISVKWSNAITFVSKYLETIYRAAGILRRHVPIYIIHNGIDLRPYYKIKLSEKQSVTVLTIVGKAPFCKGLDLVLKTFSKLVQYIDLGIKLIIVGTVPEDLTESVKKLQERGVTIDIVHNIPHNRLVELYRQADICIQLSRYDSFLLPALEAASQGCAVVVSNRTGVAEVLWGAAVIVDINDIDRIVKLVRELTLNHELRYKIGYRCFLRSLNYTYDKVAMRYIKLYIDLIRKVLK